MKRLRDNKNLVEILSRKETVSILVIILFFAAVFASMFMSPQLYRWSVREGDIALKNVYAPYNFTYFWGVDENETDRLKKVVSRNVPYVLRSDSVSQEKVLSEIDRFLKTVAAEKDREIPLEEKIKIVNTSTEIEFPEKTLKFLFQTTDLADLQEKINKILKSSFKKGYIHEEDFNYIKENGSGKVLVLGDKGVGTEEKPIEELLRAEGVDVSLENLTSEYFADDRKSRQAVVSIISTYLKPNMILDEERTEEERKNKIKKVEPVYQTWTVEKNELIVEKGKRVNARHITQLMQLRRVFRPGTSPAFFVGVLLLMLLLGLIGAVYMAFTQKANFLTETKDLSIVFLSMFMMIIIADFVIRSPQPSYFIPLASLGMTLTLLVGFNVAFLSTVLVSIFISILMGGGVNVAFVLMTGSLAGMLIARGARHRARILWAGLIAGAAKFLAVTSIGLINGMDADFFIKDGIWSIASGLFSGFIVMGLLPVFEYIFKVSTNISLLELSDLNHPVLKKLALEAPGTYHHSIMVGNLAEAASEAVGADSLRARVGAYYHDIGKINKAEYFSENEMGSKSRHEKLAPSMSSLIISKHVKEGIDIAKKYKLNSGIIDFIAQHHGDSLIAYFYQKAIEKSEEGDSLKEENFRYPGPKPQTKECAIVLLADAVEAASRTLVDPIPSSIRNLVKKIINNKFIDGQLDECDLTLKDMHKIAKSFERVLMGVFHTRLDYPEDTKKDESITVTDENTNKQRKPKQKNKDRSEEN
ncbi:MAG: HDIG domain-containing metalloprotein [Candidatus Omnitrophota bacterium]